eukprot:g26192.t1
MLAKRRRQAAAVVLEADSASSRLARLQRSETGEERKGETGTERLLRHRRIEEAHCAKEKKEVLKEELDLDLKPGVAELSFEINEEDEDLEIRQLRREKMREKAFYQVELEEEQEEVAEESEYESESEEDDPRRGPLMKPVFVSKANRETVREKELLAV